MTKDEKATQLHGNGYNCAQSVFGALSGECGIEENAALSIGAGFGGGCGCGELCGSIAGGIMAIGAYFLGGEAHDSSKARMYRGEFIQRIKEQYGAVTCRELKAPGKPVPCAEIISYCARLADEIIKNNN